MQNIQSTKLWLNRQYNFWTHNCYYHFSLNYHQSINVCNSNQNWFHSINSIPRYFPLSSLHSAEAIVTRAATLAASSEVVLDNRKTAAISLGADPAAFAGDWPWNCGSILRCTASVAISATRCIRFEPLRNQNFNWNRKWKCLPEIRHTFLMQFFQLLWCGVTEATGRTVLAIARLKPSASFLL